MAGSVVLQLLALFLAFTSVATQRDRDGPLCTSRADICFLIDSSGSIRDNNPADGSHDNWVLLLTFVETVINAFDVGSDKVRFGAVKFSNEAEVMFNLERYFDKNSIMQEVRNTGYIGGFTNTYQGLRTLREGCFRANNGDRANVPNIAIVITDGRPTMNDDRWQAEAQAVKNEDIFIMAVGITDQIENATLRELSSPPQILGRTYFTTPDFRRLDNVIDSLVDETCLVPTAPPATTTTRRRTLPPSCPFGADVVFMMDASDSIIWSDPNNWNLMKEFVATVSQSFPIDSGQFRVAVVRFARFANTEFFLPQYSTNSRVVTAINQIVLAADGAGTNIGDALRLTREEVFRNGRGDRPGAPNVGIIITDGRDSDPQRAELEAQRLRDSGVELFTIGITNDVDMNQLRRIATPPDANHVFQVGDFQRLEDIISDVIRRACDVLSTTPMPTTTTAYIPPASDCRGTAADVIFVLDASGSIGSANFQSIHQFVTNVVNDLDVESGKIQVGILTFSDNAQVRFNLNKYRTRGDIVTAVKVIPYTQGTTNLADALMSVRNNMFTSGQGDRPNARNMIILITDGKSDNGVQTRQQAALTKASGVHITTVAIGSWLDLNELEAVASFPTEQNVLRVNDFNALDRVRDNIRNYICDNEDECRNNPCVRGQCRNGIGYAYCVCEPGYSGPRCDKRCNTGGDVVFVLDNSGSIGRENFNKMMKFIRNTVSYLDIDRAGTSNSGTRVGIVSYADNVQPQFNLNAYTNAVTLLNNINVRYTGGKTNTAAAIKYLRETMYRTENGDRPGVDNVAVIITDGRSNDADATWKEALEARKAGIKLIVVGIGRGVDDMELKSMASDPVESNVISVDNFDGLQAILNAVSDGLCNNQNECASNPCQNGATCTDVLNGYDCSPCPPGFTGYNCERRCTGVADVAFLIDASGSIRSERFPIIKDFVKAVVENLDVHPDNTRIGAIYWSQDAKTQFRLSEYTNRQDVIQAVQRIPFMGGKTFTTSAIRMLRQELFTGRNGDRRNVQNYVILITDGNSNIDPQRTIPEAIAARNEGAHIIVVAVGQDVNSAELRGMASYPKAVNIYNVERISQLPSLKEQIITSTCNDVDECSSNPCRNGGRCVDGIRSYTCICQGDWSDMNCDRRCGKQMDVTLILDLSGSVEEQKEMILQFARRMAYGLNTQGDRVRIAAVAFSTDIIDRFYLNTFQSQSAIVNALTFYHRNGKTNIAQALRVTRDEIYTPVRGDRDRVRNVAILISDGQATINPGSTIPQATDTKRRQIELFTVGVANKPNMEVLSEIASDPDTTHVYRLPNINDIERTANQLLSYLCQ